MKFIVLLADCKRASVTKKELCRSVYSSRQGTNSDTLFLGGGDRVKQVRGQRVSSSY